MYSRVVGFFIILIIFKKLKFYFMSSIRVLQTFWCLGVVATDFSQIISKGDAVLLNNSSFLKVILYVRPYR